MVPGPPRARDWTFTVFLPPDWVYEHNADVTRYCIFQEEVAPDTGRHHYQGYIQFKRPKRLSEVKNILGRQDAHLEIMRGTREEARDYCRKEDSRVPGYLPQEHGVFVATGARPDFKQQLELATDPSRRLSQVVVEQPEFFARHYRAIERMRQLKMKARSGEEDVHVVAYWGEPGSGKTHRMFHDFPVTDDVFIMPDDGVPHYYDGERIVLWDEFDDTQVPLKRFLRFVDKWPTKSRILYGVAPISAMVIALTSCRPPSEWYNIETPTSRREVERRIKEVVHVQRSDWE